MAKHHRKWNQIVYEKYIAEGRGQGEGKDYRPWIRIQDFASLGTVSRIYSSKTKRVHHLLSNNEKYYFYLLEWSENIMDIREQFPLSDIKTAMDVAANAGIRYPTDKNSGFPYVMTCDFMLTTPHGLKARTVKQASELSNPRIVEKLEIERQYWKRLGIDWKLVADRGIDIPKARAIEWVRQDDNTFVYDDFIVMAEAKQRFASAHSPIAVANSLDRDFNLSKGAGMSIFKQLLRTKQIQLSSVSEIGIVNVNLLCTAR